jgi:uncharacterized glyoxalase superfamily protein PhnB
MTHLTYKPNGYTSVLLYLIVNDAAGTIRFLTAIFGAEEIRRFSSPDGRRLMHAEVRLDDSIIMLGECAESGPAEGAHVHIYVSDVDHIYGKALHHGALSLQEPLKKSDQDDKRGGVKDPFGTSWWIATKVT